MNPDAQDTPEHAAKSTEPVNADRAERRRALRLLAAWGFPVVLWLVATLFLGGALGRNTDDYAINFRDPVTGAIPEDFNPFRNYPFFWRPLHVFMCFTVGTLIPEQDRIVHVACAVFHGAACLGLFVLLRWTLRSTLGPAAAALLFMVIPLNGEVPLWFCTTSTAIGAAFTFAALLAVVHFARGDERTGGGRWGTLLLIAGLAFIVPCWYEQSAAPLAAIPAVYLACCPPTQRWRTRIVRLGVATATGGGMCLLYVGLLLATAPKHARGGAGSIVTLERLPDRLREFARGVEYNLGERAQHVLMGSFTEGLRTIGRPESVVFGLALLCTIVLWLAWLARRDGASPPIAARRTPDGERERAIGRARLWMLVAGVIVFGAGWLPVLVIDRQIIELRNLYAPLIGAAMALAVVLDAMVRGVHRVSGSWAIWARTVLALVLIVPMLLGAIGMVGFQRHMQARYEQDQSEIRQLVRLVPNPPKDAVFAPFRTTHVTDTGYPLFDRSRLGVFETSWSGTPELRRAYRRSDISATVHNPWAPLPLVEPDEHGIRYTLRPQTTPAPQASIRGGRATRSGGELLRWETLVPFVVDRDGRARLIRRIDMERADHRDLEIRPAVVAEALAQRSAARRLARERGEPEPEPIPTTTHRFAMVEEMPPDLIPIGGWVYLDAAGAAQGEAQFARVNCWNVFREATWLSPGTGRTAMRTVLAPSDRAEHLLVRATIGGYDLDKLPDAPPIELVITVRDVAAGGVPERELGTLLLEPRALRQTRRWMPLIVTVPPRGPEGAEIRMAVRVARRGSDSGMSGEPGEVRQAGQGGSEAAASGGPLPPVWVTHGYQQSIVDEVESGPGTGE